MPLIRISDLALEELKKAKKTDYQSTCYWRFEPLSKIASSIIINYFRNLRENLRDKKVR